MPGPKTKSPAENFAKHVIKRDGCWAWHGSKHKFGYGWFRVGGKTMLAHRVSYELARGPLQPGIVIRHTCDNPECTNPDHLATGTHADNVADRFARGRHVRSDGKYANTIITTEQIERIRPMLDQGMSYRAIGSVLGFSGDTIKRHAMEKVTT